jgi:hypothetical protein
MDARLFFAPYILRLLWRTVSGKRTIPGQVRVTGSAAHVDVTEGLPSAKKWRH